MKTLKEIWNDWFPEPHPTIALEAYTQTRYGIKLDSDSLYKKSIEEITALMQAKSDRRSYSLIYDLDENLPDLNNKLVEYFCNIGFNCFILDSNIDKRIETPKLYLSWSMKNR